jgi:hypothetical protein
VQKVVVDVAMLREHVKIRFLTLTRLLPYKKEELVENLLHTEWEEKAV